jgi:protein involved in polysaccharide export with SLBB domain
MNICLNQSSNRKLPDVKGCIPRRWIMRVINLSGEALKTGLAAAVVAGVLCGGVLKAADAAIGTDVMSSNPVVAMPAAAVTTSPTNAANMLDDKYRLTIGDHLSFQITEDEDDPVPLVVTDSGDLQVPYIGRYPAVGKTCKELAQALKVELEKEYYKQATVIIAVDSKPESRGKIYLVGAIRAPGPEDISSDEVLTVSKAILRAGGFTEFADEKNVKVTRSTGAGPGGDKTFIVNVSRIFEQGKTKDDMPLQPGDLVFIPERMIRF